MPCLGRLVPIGHSLALTAPGAPLGPFRTSKVIFVFNGGPVLAGDLKWLKFLKWLSDYYLLIESYELGRMPQAGEHCLFSCHRWKNGLPEIQVVKQIKWI